MKTLFYLAMFFTTLGINALFFSKQGDYTQITFPIIATICLVGGFIVKEIKNK
jgi:hypothetical protein